MPTKEELSQEINEVLGTNMEWDRMLEDDINLFHELVMDGALVEPQAKQFAKKHGKSKLEKEVDDWYPGKIAGRLL